MGDTQAEAEVNMTTAAKRAAWKRQKANMQDSQLKRAVRRETRVFTGSATLHTKHALKNMSRI